MCALFAQGEDFRFGDKNNTIGFYDYMNMIVAYDIADPKRLGKIARIMKDYGHRVQQSIFEADIDERTFAEMRRRVEFVLVRAVDGVKYFPLCGRCADTLVALGVCAVVPLDEDYLLL
jgi:CRISPR-associated protein Cas2